MAAEHKDGSPVDPFEAFRGMRDSYLDAMSKVMINAVNSEEYAQATGAMVDSSLMASAPFREALDKAAALQQASMPSRQEVAALAGRFTNIEMRLDDMEAKLDRIIQLCSVANPGPAGAGSHENSKAKGKSPQRKSPRKG